jgi:uncharacterized UBP type Zn finger protein
VLCNLDTPGIIEPWSEGKAMSKDCLHFQGVTNREGNTDGCEECLRSGDSWVHLRVCLVCGHVGCCDDSKNKHATKHFHATAHPVIRSGEPGEHWGWCYVDQLFKDQV